MSENNEGRETPMDDVREYAEGFAVKLVALPGSTDKYSTVPQGGRLVVQALNEGGYNCTQVDLLDMIKWVRKHRPELLAP